ncbi:stalk domain-containing protein [Paenibacillus sp. NPDC058174]|uniref:stalk domain-containing protein n=1 Tax=Paenibacillus sp. NPDC058174 TaxID=3346366 RepID=UPI0036DD06BC
MTHKKKLIVLLTAAGLLGTSAVVGAAGMVEKVTGILHKDVKVVVNGENTSLTPVYINGQAYVPVRGAAAELGYTLHYDAKNKEIELNGKGQEEADYMRGTGVIVNVAEDKGQYRIELLGKGSNSWVILFADAKTVIKDQAGKAVAAKDLKAGQQINVEYGPVMTMSFPGQSHAAKITVEASRAVKEDVIQSVKHTEDGWQIQFGETKDGKAVPTLTLNAGKETSVLTPQGESVKWEDLKAGTKVRAYYGPFETKSIPPQSPLFYLVVLSDVQAPGKMTPEAAQQYRDLAWEKVSDQAKHIKTKKDEAVVEIVSAQHSGVMASSDEQKKLLAEIKAANGNLVTVTYITDQDELLGPLTAVFDFNTKAFIGFNIRK